MSIILPGHMPKLYAQACSGAVLAEDRALTGIIQYVGQVGCPTR